MRLSCFVLVDRLSMAVIGGGGSFGDAVAAVQPRTSIAAVGTRLRRPWTAVRSIGQAACGRCQKHARRTAQAPLSRTSLIEARDGLGKTKHRLVPLSPYTPRTLAPMFGAMGISPSSYTTDGDGETPRQCMPS